MLNYSFQNEQKSTIKKSTSHTGVLTVYVYVCWEMVIKL